VPPGELRDGAPGQGPAPGAEGAWPPQAGEAGGHEEGDGRGRRGTGRDWEGQWGGTGRSVG